MFNKNRLLRAAVFAVAALLAARLALPLVEAYPLGAGVLLLAVAAGRKDRLNSLRVILGAALGAALFGWAGHALGQLAGSRGSLAPLAWLGWGWDVKADGWPAVLGRAGLVLGAFSGLTYKGKAVHDERHVHGLEVAAGSPEKGTRRWAGESDLAHVAEFGPPREGRFGGGTIVGKLKGRIVRLYPDKCRPPLPQHACVVAGTGAGKTYSFVIPNAIAAACEGESLVLTDPKGELACLLAPWLKSKGYKVYVFNLAYPQWSSCWNPVLEARDDEEITAFATAIVQNAAADRSGYFVMKEIQLLKALTYLLRCDFPPEQAHLRSALSLLSWPQEALDERFERAYREGRLPQEGYEEWRGAVSSNYDNAVSGLSAKINVVRAEGVAKLLSRHEIDLSVLGRERAALFCVLPIGSGHLKPVLATFYYFFFKRLYQLAAECGGRLPNPTRFILDEFANVGEIPGFVEVISTARSLGVRIQFVLQGLKQLTDIYGFAEAEAVMSNCPIQTFLGGDDATTTKYFSQRLGDAAVWATSERVSRRAAASAAWEFLNSPALGGGRAGRTETKSVVRRPLMTSEELAGMDPMAAVCLVRWALPVYLTKVGWEELPQAREIRALAARSLSEVCPARPDVKVELPPVPEGPPPEPKKRDRQERHGGRPPLAPGGGAVEDAELEELGI
ncbi:VirD4-like conjugal transfer protein, CD1115 family [Neomoorella mulderi]|uniref:Conjugal transfer protein TraG n=1 Tax=Moorella mulderi DSM 14980 TaxID=1122241 RepID=A0A151ASR5_9FIRM|nr:conjugal transfer protein TraG [Moorella mulderi DSM 14980]